MKLFEMIQQIGSRAGTRAATAFLKSLSLTHSLNIGADTPDRHPPHKGPSFIPERCAVHLFRPVFVTNALKKLMPN
jgi:hypothetical protein